MDKIPRPICPYDKKTCTFESLFPSFREFGEEYIGNVSVCRVCAIHKLKDMMGNINDNVKLLRYST